MPWPTRMGLVTLHALLRKIVQLAANFRPLWVQYLSETDVALLDALIAKAQEVLDRIPQYEPLP